MNRRLLFSLCAILGGLLIFSGCVGEQGPQGPSGPQGSVGPQGPPGELSEEQAEQLEKVVGFVESVPFPSLENVPRGCPACHVLIDDEGHYTLPFEAHERAEVRGAEHPEVAPDGTSLAVTEEVNVTVCLQCHASGSGDREGMGVIAPLSLRDIVHPAHMSSQFFKLHYGGNCFTCHNVNGQGEFELLTRAVEVNEKGVPDPAQVPIPGAYFSGKGSVSRGGRLYDKWWTVAGAAEPTEDQPLWDQQATNERSGSATWRCKECHGWDYSGAAGAYGSGSHFTGFPGVLAAQSKTASELAAQIAGKTDSNHDFSAMGTQYITDLVAFLMTGTIDVSPFIDSESKAAVGGDAAAGQTLYANACQACHGEDGRAINFHDAAEPEYVGTIAIDNPWEFIHKVRMGQPGTSMPASIDLGWSLQDVVDLLAFAQSLPTAAP